ncbi:MAG: Crp/Fnr family transcriptional regulator [Cyclobacteriaceae bacterium]
MNEEGLLKEDISKYIKLTDGEFDYYFNLLKINKYKKRENLHSIGKVCRSAFFVLEGSIRYFNIVDGEEKTGQFFFEGSWYSDYESFLFHVPSEQSIQAIEQTTVAILSKEALYQLYEKIPKFERFGRIMAENAFMGLRKRTLSLTSLSATERYLELTQNRPKVIKRIPQKYIASYLDIKPQSLSRIRNELLRR